MHKVYNVYMRNIQDIKQMSAEPATKDWFTKWGNPTLQDNCALCDITRNNDFHADLCHECYLGEISTAEDYE